MIAPNAAVQTGSRRRTFCERGGAARASEPAEPELRDALVRSRQPDDGAFSGKRPSMRC
jgi:hypothetical protein